MTASEKSFSAQKHFAFLAGGGEMADRVRSFDWSRTPVGPVADWPQSLKIAVRIMLDSRYAMWLGWGAELTFFYNDSYARMTLGPKHPWALGRPCREVWSEIWGDIGPRAESVLRSGQATWDEALLLFLERRGFPEETYHTFSYSPVPDDRGGVGGLLCVVTEDTERTIGERRLRTLRELAARTTDEARSVEEACQTAARILAANPQDVPFALLYLLDSEGRRVTLAGQTGVGRGTFISPVAVALQDGSVPWPFRTVAESGKAVEMSSLPSELGPLPGGAWPEPTQQAVILPMAKPGQTQRAGFVVVGVSPRRPFDDGYRGFFDLLAGQIATAVSNARAYEEELRRAEQLAELDRAKTAFFSNVSHEFRTPLTLLLGPVEDMLARPAGGVPPEDRESLFLVHRSALRLQKLVNTLLDFSRIEAGRVQAVYEPTNLAALTAELASNFRSACEKAGLRLIVDCPPLAEPVYVDHDMWEKVVLNLLSNAFKFTFEGEIALSLRLAGRHVELSVRDTGAGIPADQMSRLFERFHRVKGARGRTQEGSGIGLALVRELARLHGGEIRAESEQGKGSTFTVSLPRGTAHLPADRIGAARTTASTALGAAAFVEEALRWLPDPPSSSAPSHSVAATHFPSHGEHHYHPSTGPRPRILLADDNADMREYVRRLLADRYDVIAVADGLAARDAARRTPPNLILTDVMMPGLDGFALLRELRANEHTRSVPILLLSARAGEEARVEGLQAGADDYLTKPFSARELLARVEGQLQMARLRRESEQAVRESEERFQSFMDHSPTTAYIKDADGCYLFVNRQVEQQFNRPVAEWIGKTDLEIFPTDEGRLIRQNDLSVLSSRRTAQFVESSTRPDGVRQYLSFKFPLQSRDGSWLLAGMSIDITEQKRAEEELKEADRRKDEFLALLAHELRNPLAPLRNGLQIFRLAGHDREAVEQARAMMERQLASLVRIVDDLLDVSRITRNKLELRRERVDLAEVIQSAVETNHPVLLERGHELTVELPLEPVPLDADLTRLAQVFANLLNNSAKYTPRGGRIRLVAERQGEQVVVSVHDNGIGIPAESLARIFDMFSQVDRTLERTTGGLGIGLSLVKGLVEMHNGTVEARSGGEGKGSTFTVRLPLGKGEQHWETHGAGNDEPPDAARRRVLVVDDNRDSAESLAMLLRLSGNEVRIAHDGLEAIDTAEEYRPDLILMDVGMPRLNGLDATRRIREQPWGRQVVIFALTGWGQEGDRQRTTDAGCDGHLVKPVAPAALERLLARLESANDT